MRFDLTVLAEASDLAVDAVLAVLAFFAETSVLAVLAVLAYFSISIDILISAAGAEWVIDPADM